ncbi:MAG: hypothetical protein V4510_08395 [bacterium]
MDGPSPERTALTPMLEELRLSRNRLWLAFAAMVAVCVASFVVASAVFHCEYHLPCTTAQDAWDGGLSLVALITLALAPILLVFAVRAQARFQKIFNEQAAR